MKLYFAGAESDLLTLNECQANNILISIASGYKNILKYRKVFDKKTQLIIDSGAFTFQKKGGLSVDKWIETISKIYTKKDILISYDVIGDGQKTRENYEIIKQYFPKALPTWHVSSDIEYLKYYLDKSDYICIGGMVNAQNWHLRLDKVFALTKDRYKLHAFSVFADKTLTRYPFYSSDSTGWLSAAKFNVHRFFKNGRITREATLKEIRNKKKENRNKHIHIAHAMDRKTKTKLHITEVLKYEKYLTDLWTKRGVIWND